MTIEPIDSVVVACFIAVVVLVIIFVVVESTLAATDIVYLIHKRFVQTIGRDMVPKPERFY